MECSRFDFACHFSNLMDYLRGLFFSIYDSILQSIAGMLTAIPMPDFMQNGSVFGSVSADILYFIAPFNLGTGVGIILSAYGVRFLIRRLPIIG